MRFRAALGVALACFLLGAGAGLVAARLTTWNPFALTTHQLDVLRTMGSVVGAIGGALTVINLVYSILARRYAKKAYENTSTEDWSGGDLVRTPMAEGVRHARIAAEATRQEVGDLAGWVKGTGRRRLATTEVPRLEDSTYE